MEIITGWPGTAMVCVGLVVMLVLMLLEIQRAERAQEQAEYLREMLARQLRYRPKTKETEKDVEEE